MGPRTSAWRSAGNPAGRRLPSGREARARLRGGHILRLTATTRRPLNWATIWLLGCMCVCVCVHAQLSCCLCLCRLRHSSFPALGLGFFAVCLRTCICPRVCRLIVICVFFMFLSPSTSLSFSLSVALFPPSWVSLSRSQADSLPLSHSVFIIYLSTYLTAFRSLFQSLFLSLSFSLSGELSEFCCCMLIFLSLHLSISLLICLFLYFFTHPLLFLLFLMIILFL